MTPARPANLLPGLVLLCCLGAPIWSAAAEVVGDRADAQAVEAIVASLAVDEEHAFLRTLAPTREECGLLFRLEVDANLVCDYADAMYEGLEGIPEDAMKPITEDGDTLILRADPALIEAGVAHPVFAPFATLAVRLRPETTLYAFVFVDADGKPQKSRAYLARAGERWVFVPQLHRAFGG